MTFQFDCFICGQIALQEGFTFMRWFVQQWNVKAKDFYQKEGAQNLTVMEGEHSFAFSRSAMEAMAEHSEKRLVTSLL